MIPHQDRVPYPGKAGWRSMDVVSSTAAGVPVGARIVAKVDFADDATTIGTDMNAAKANEFLSASGTTTGTSSALALAQPGFVLADGAMIRFKLHTTTTAPFTMNVAGTGAIPWYDAQGNNTTNYNINTWATGVYSSALNRWIAQGAGMQVIDSLASTSTTAALSANQGRVLKNTNAIGVSALAADIGGSNTAFGYYALSKNSSGSQNTAVGTNALLNNTVGIQNTAVGNGAAASNIIGVNITAVGHSAAQSVTGDNNIAIGAFALSSNGSGKNNVVIGPYYGNQYTPTNSSILISAYSDTTGVGLSECVMVGGYTPTSNLSGCVAIGHNAAITGFSSTAIGAYSEVLHANSTALGYTAMSSGHNQITLGNSSITQLRCQVQTISSLSDRRIKENIQPANIEMCLDAVKSLPVTRYKYKDFTGTHLDTHVTGWLADDVEKVFPKAVQKADESFPELDKNGEKIYETDENGIEREKRFKINGVKSITMTEALPTLWGAVQALAAKVETLEKEIAELKAR